MIYNLNEMTSLTEDFLITYYSVFPFTFKMFLTRTDIRGGICGEKTMLMAFYDYKKNSREELPHYNIENYLDNPTDIRQVRITQITVEN
jgi:hypothetical protein